MEDFHVVDGGALGHSLCMWLDASTPCYPSSKLASWCAERVHLLVSFVTHRNRARQLYKNISMLFLFPVKDGKLSTGVNATFDASCYG